MMMAALNILLALGCLAAIATAALAFLAVRYLKDAAHAAEFQATWTADMANSLRQVAGQLTQAEQADVLWQAIDKLTTERSQQ